MREDRRARERKEREERDRGERERERGERPRSLDVPILSAFIHFAWLWECYAFSLSGSLGHFIGKYVYMGCIVWEQASL